MTDIDRFDKAERFGEREIALAMFDCISNKLQKNVVVCNSIESYERRFRELMEAHHEAPITGVEAMDFSAGLITFDSGSELWFTVRSTDDAKVDNEDSEQMPDNPPEKLNEFLDGFKVS